VAPRKEWGSVFQNAHFEIVNLGLHLNAHI
jgi:hypothetical protein